MKTILIFSLICFAFSIWGPAEEAARPGSTFCDDRTDPESSSDCVDLYLYGQANFKNEKKYYDRCCYVKFQLYGIEDVECRALTQEQYLDIVETKKNMEKEYDKYYRDEAIPIYYGETSTEGYRTKIYQIDCASSYIKFLSIASILLALLF